jgi:hypothetical protein
MRWLKCLFGKHDFYNTGEVGYVGDYCEMAMGYYAEVWKCKNCGTKRPGAVVREFKDGN